MLCCNNFKVVSEKLCQSIANMTKRLCTEDVNFKYVSHLMACRLIPLVKDDDGVRPIGIGEVLRRIMAKSVARVLRNEITQSTGSLQTCPGIEGGIEASVHAMADVLLVDAENAFNSLNRKTALLNIKEICTYIQPGKSLKIILNLRLLYTEGERHFGAVVGSETY